MKKPVVWISFIIGVLFIALAVYYWSTPAGSLPAYLPGYVAGSAHVHFKHGLASLILGLGVLVFAWFKSAPSKSHL